MLLSSNSYVNAKLFDTIIADKMYFMGVETFQKVVRLGLKKRAQQAWASKRRRRLGVRFGKGCPPPQSTSGSGGASWAPTDNTFLAYLGQQHVAGNIKMRFI